MNFEKINSSKFTQLNDMNTVVGGAEPTYEWRGTKGHTDEVLFTTNPRNYPPGTTGNDGPVYPC